MLKREIRQTVTKDEYEGLAEKVKGLIINSKYNASRLEQSKLEAKLNEFMKKHSETVSTSYLEYWKG